MFSSKIPVPLATKGGESSVEQGEMGDSRVVQGTLESFHTCKGRHAAAQEAEGPLKAP